MGPWFVVLAALLFGGAGGPGGLGGGGPEPTVGRIAVSGVRVVWIPAGPLVRGSDSADLGYASRLCARGALTDDGCHPAAFEDEAPRHRVWIAAYGIDRTEVTHAAYGRCIAASRCAPPELGALPQAAVPDPAPRAARSALERRAPRPNHPVAGVTWAQAARYCAFVGGRLPTEAEWERAARGGDTRRFPWGRYYNDRLANHGRWRLLMGGRLARGPDDIDGFRYAAPVGSYPGARSPFGVLDMAGNVSEWVQDRYDPDAYVGRVRIDPAGPAQGARRVVRGGSWRDPGVALRVTHRRHLPATVALPDVGFRCAYDETRP